jgi:hypothetical protein
MPDEKARGDYSGTLEFILLIAGIAGIIFPAFLEAPRPGPWELVTSLFHPTLTYVFVARWLSVIFILLAIYIRFVRWIYKPLPISVIWTRVDLRYLNSDGSRIKFVRQQALRANQRGVSAYYQEISPSSETGRVPENEIQASVTCGNRTLASELDLHGDEKKGYEIIHEFREHLPYSKLLLVAPIRLLNYKPERMWRFVRERIPIRHITMTFVNEFNVPKPSLSISTGSVYAQHNLSLYLHFPDGVTIKKLRARRQKSNSVIDVALQYEGSARYLFIDRLEKNETLRVTWEI